MKRLVIAGILFLSLIPSVFGTIRGYDGPTDLRMRSSLQPITIISEGDGGAIDGAYYIMNFVKKNKIKLVVDGKCYSACTFFLNLPVENMCFTEKAKFFFHAAAYLDKNKKVILDKDESEEIIGDFRPEAQAWIKEAGAVEQLEFTHMPRTVLLQTYGDHKC